MPTGISWWKIFPTTRKNQLFSYMENKNDIRIVYMGTPEFAVAGLKALVENGYNVVGVVSMPDKPAGRGMKLQYSSVKEYALAYHLPLLQPEKLKDPDFLESLQSWKADLQIVVAFRMLPEVVWNMPRLGTFNLHASLLPQYRGAAPINWAIINGETETGVTTFFLTREIDMGHIILQECIPIMDTDNAGAIHDRLMNTGADLVVRTVDQIIAGDMNSTPQDRLIQDKAELRMAPKIFKESCEVNWSQDIKKIYDFIRGLSPYPAAWADLTTPSGNLLNLKILETEKRFEAHSLTPGTILSDGKSFIDVAGTDGFIRLLLIQQAGKKRMSVVEFLRGCRWVR